MKRIGFAYNPTSATGPGAARAGHGLVRRPTASRPGRCPPTRRPTSPRPWRPPTPSSCSAATARSCARPMRWPTWTCPSSASTWARSASSPRRSTTRSSTCSAQLRDGEFELEPRLMLDVARGPPGRPAGRGQVHIALNEAAVVRGGHAQVMRVVVDVGDSRVATYICDGVVVASPTGSTGYSFSAGGPILEPTSRNLVVTPIAAYLTPLRSSVVGPQHVVSVTVQAAYDCLVSIDGREDVPLEVGDRVEVQRPGEAHQLHPAARSAAVLGPAAPEGHAASRRLSDERPPALETPAPTEAPRDLVVAGRRLRRLPARRARPGRGHHPSLRHRPAALRPRRAGHRAAGPARPSRPATTSAR